MKEHHILEMDSVLKTFGLRELLTDVYLRIETGDIIGLFGRNGTGKSVLLKILFGTMLADRKFIRLDHSKCFKKTHTHPGLISYLPQDHFFPQNLKIEKIVDLYLLPEEKESFFNDDNITDLMRKSKSKDLSGGESRYLEIKLLLYNKTKFLILDEPFNYLSPLWVEEISKLIIQQSATKGIIITDHNYEQVLKLATRILILKEGVLKELTHKQGLVEQGYLRELHSLG